MHGEIRFKKSIEDEVKCLENYKNYVRLGTSKKDDYGLAELTLEALEDDASDVTVNNEKELIVYLESDVLLRNGNLRQTNLVEDLKTKLEKVLGQGTLKSLDEVIEEAKKKLEENPNDEESKNVIGDRNGSGNSLIQVRRIESWHEGWGLPRPTLTAMAAGSVVVFDVVGKIDDTKLQNLELSGIGERRGEGYGQVRFNPPLLMNPINGWISSTKTKPPTNESNDSLTKLKTQIHNADKLKEFISIIERSAWRDELARAVLKLADDEYQRKKIFGFEIEVKDSKKNSIPSLSQIGGLRSAIGRLKLDGSNKNVVTEWVKHLEITENRRKIWDSTNESYSDKLNKIKKLINDETEVWKMLEQADSTSRPYWNLSTEFVTPRTEIQTKLWAEAVKSLFDACARAHKRETEDK